MKRSRLLLTRIILATFFTAINWVAASAQAPTYEVYALKFGERTHKVAIKDVAIGATGSDSVQVNFMYWLLKGSNGKLILVDAGFTDDFEINPQFITFTQPDVVLQQLQIKPTDITDIIITHPHWDHIGGIDLFPNAQVYMQKADYEYFVSTAWQPGGNATGFNQKDVLKIVNRNLSQKLTLVNGDNQEILPGITVYTGSKHTYEAQYVAIGTGPDKVIIASDNAWYYYNVQSQLPIPLTHSTKAYTKNLKRMRAMVQNPDLILPGHDPLVFTKFPVVAPGVVNIGR